MVTGSNPLGQSQSNPFTSTGSNPNTYNPSSGTYTTSSGQGVSTPNAPSGSIIIGGGSGFNRASGTSEPTLTPTIIRSEAPAPVIFKAPSTVADMPKQSEIPIQILTTAPGQGAFTPVLQREDLMQKQRDLAEERRQRIEGAKNFWTEFNKLTPKQKEEYMRTSQKEAQVTTLLGQKPGAVLTSEARQVQQNILTGKTTTPIVAPNVTSTTPTTFLGKAINWLEGSPALPFFSISIPGKGVIAGKVPITKTTPEGFTISTFKQMAGEFGPIPGGIAGVIPETRGGLALTEATTLGFGALPKIAQIGIGGAITGFETSKVISPTTTTQEKITAGIIGLGAGAGTAAETIPFLKGAFARLSPEYAPVKVQPEGFKAIELKEGQIGLIPEKSPLKLGTTTNVELPSTSPLKKGAFGFTPSQTKAFVSKEPQFLATSFQSTLLKPGVNVPIERLLFATPQELTLGIPQARISRLGLTDLFAIPKETQIGFGVPPQPQIILTKAKVGFEETPTGFKIGPITGELQATKSYGIIQDVTKLGITSLKGQKVDVFGYNIGEGIGGTKLAPITQTTYPIARTSGEITLSVSSLSNLLTAKTTTPSEATTSIITPTTSKIYFIPSESRKIFEPTPTISIPSKSIDIFQPSKTFPTQQSYKENRPTPTPPFLPPTFKPQKITSKTPTKGLIEDMFGILIRKKKRFVEVGTAPSLFKATEKLKEQVFSGLEQSGMIVKKRTGEVIPFSQLGLGGQFRVSKKSQLIAIQKNPLATRTEVFKIQAAKRTKSKKSKFRWL